MLVSTPVVTAIAVALNFAIAYVLRVKILEATHTTLSMANGKKQIVIDIATLFFGMYETMMTCIYVSIAVVIMITLCHLRRAMNTQTNYKKLSS